MGLFLGGGGMLGQVYGLHKGTWSYVYTYPNISSLKAACLHVPAMPIDKLLQESK